MAVSTRDGVGEKGVPARLRDTIFAIAEQLLEPAERSVLDSLPDDPNPELILRLEKHRR